MVKPRLCVRALVALLAGMGLAAGAGAQQAGSIRGMVYDKDFDAVLPEATVQLAETGEKVRGSSEGNYVFRQVEPGVYTLVFGKEGYTRLVKTDVVVSPGQLTEVDAWLSGEFTDMEEFVVQEVNFGAGTEAALLELRMEAPALMDSISADLMSQAGAGDAASALRLVAGASVQDGKFAVIRGLPDRYVNSQLNGVRLPTADADKRAVQLDQFPSDAIESIQVSKTFTPDQQGDASGGAVNVRLKGIPEETVFKVSIGTKYQTQVSFMDDFLSYDGGGVNFWGDDDIEIQDDKLGESWSGAVGVSREDSPWAYDWTISGGGKYSFENDVRIGAFSSFFYERDASFYDDGIDDKYWVEDPGGPMTPQYVQGSPGQGDFKTQLFDVARGSEQVQWGWLGVAGLEYEDRHAITLTNLFTRIAEDEATLAEDTRGKSFYFPGYDVNDPTGEGNQERDAAPFLRTETLQYNERTTHTLQLAGHHELFEPDLKVDDVFTLLPPEVDWGIAYSSAELYEPDKRQFGSKWWAPKYSKGYPPYIPPSTDEAVHRPFKPAANFTLGNLQRVWKNILEESNQYFINLKLPFEQWNDKEGYVKLGVFNDEVEREYEQESFSNFNDNSGQYSAGWEAFWSERFPGEEHPITAGEIDVDYQGEQDISAWYFMVDLPLFEQLKVIGGVRFEDTDLSIINDPERDVTWIPPGAPGQVNLKPGDADVAYSQSDVLPSIGFVFTPFEQLTVRGTYSETVARQTFKELSPIQQQEFLGGDVFIGNPTLQMSSLVNYDLRVDYTPYEGGLLSASYFRKEITDPIEYVQRIADFSYTTPVNYPEGELKGIELEIRQDAGRFLDLFAGLTVGANATFIKSEVVLPDDEAELFEEPNIAAPMPTRDMTNAPDYLYNLFFTYDLGNVGLEDAQLGLFYTVRGDTLIAGAGQSKGNFVPNVYEKRHSSLNMSFRKTFAEDWNFSFKAKNLTDPARETVYRSKYIGDDVVKTSYHKGMEFSVGLSYAF